MNQAKKVLKKVNEAVGNKRLNEKNTMSFDNWMKLIRIAIYNKTGRTYKNLPKWGYKDAYAGDIPPDAAADLVIKYGE